MKPRIIPGPDGLHMVGDERRGTMLDAIDRQIIATVKRETDPTRYARLVEALRDLLADAGTG
jgi:hypothetical protein